MDCFSAERFPKALKQLLQNPKLVAVAVNISADAPRLRALGVNLKNMVEIMEMAKQYEPKHSEGFGMQKLCSRLLNLYVDKFGQQADWSGMQDSIDLKRYAALDAYLHWKLHSQLTKLLAAGKDNGAIPAGYSEGDRVQV